MLLSFDRERTSYATRVGSCDSTISERRRKPDVILKKTRLQNRVICLAFSMRLRVPSFIALSCDTKPKAWISRSLRGLRPHLKCMKADIHRETEFNLIMS
jgi:hypothetical protein